MPTIRRPMRIRKPHKPRFYLATRDTRWDVYPNREPVEAIAHDYEGFWALTAAGEWFKTPTSYNLVREITEDEALAFPFRRAAQPRKS